MEMEYVSLEQNWKRGRGEPSGGGSTQSAADEEPRGWPGKAVTATFTRAYIQDGVALLLLCVRSHVLIRRLKSMPLSMCCVAEFLGTFWLVLGGCGSAVLAAALPGVGIGFLGVSLAFGLTILTMAYAIARISGCHLNPAVSVGLWFAGRFPANKLLAYIVVQVAGALVAGGVLFIIANGRAGFDVSLGLASNGYGTHSPGGYSLLSGAICEVVMTTVFLFVILRSTDLHAPKDFAPFAIGLCLTLIHLISIPVTNTSVNPARSTGVALYAGGWAIRQLWLFWLAPIIGALVGAAIYRFFSDSVFEAARKME